MNVTPPYDAYVPELADHPQVVGHVTKGVAIDVPADLGKRLVDQGWTSAAKVAAKKRARAKTSTAPTADPSPNPVDEQLDTVPAVTEE